MSRIAELADRDPFGDAIGPVPEHLAARGVTPQRWRAAWWRMHLGDERADCYPKRGTMSVDRHAAWLRNMVRP